MTSATSSFDKEHPGTILFDDQVDNRQWVEKADEVPQTMAWFDSDGILTPVVLIKITGTVERQRITKYGEDGEFLETTIQLPIGTIEEANEQNIAPLPPIPPSP